METSDQSLAQTATMPENVRYQHYEVLKRTDGDLWELGRGAMGVTYKAYDTDLRRPVALKVITAASLESESARRRFLREARAAAAFRHQNIASVFHLGMDHGNYFYAMEFIDGQTVDEYVKQKGKLTSLEALEIGIQVTRALAASAKQGLVHRDLKPANLMLVDEEGERVIKVIDFGLVKTLKPQNNLEFRTLTMAGSFIGNPHFASPEQLEEGDVDGRSDIYSLGAILYYLVTGCPPFSGSVAQIMSRHLYKPPPVEPLQGFSSSFVNLILSMMAKEKGKRPQSAGELREAIQQCARQLRKMSAIPPVTPRSGEDIQVLHRGLLDQVDTARELVHSLSSRLRGRSAVKLSAPTHQPPIPGKPPFPVEPCVELARKSQTPAVPGIIPQELMLFGTLLAQNYRLVEKLDDSPHGWRFLADDLRRMDRRITLLVLSEEFVSDILRFGALEEAVERLSRSPHPMLQKIFSLETLIDCNFLVEEHLAGQSLLEILRVRSLFGALEVVRLINLLAPLADHANAHRLRHLDLTLRGIRSANPELTPSEMSTGFIPRSLCDWEHLEPKVGAINFSLLPFYVGRGSGEETLIQEVATNSFSPGNYVRPLSLLAYELLGGTRLRVETAGQYTPIAGLTEAGNVVLRRGLGEDYASAGELAKGLAVAVGRIG